MKGVHSILFDTLADAVEYAMQQGGWICKDSSGTVQWFDPARWTTTAIIDATSQHGTREIGTWPMFFSTPDGLPIGHLATSANANSGQ